MRSVLIVALSFDDWHIFELEEAWLFPLVRYSILIVIDVIDRNIVIGASWGLVWTQNGVTGFWIYNIWFTWVSNTELRHVSSFGETQISSIEVRLFVLTRSSPILKCLESLIKLINTDARHSGFLIQ